jgi:hypothetical protein
MRELVAAHGPFVSIHLPPGAGWRVWGILRHSLDIDAATVELLDRALTSAGAGPGGRSLIAAESRLLVDESPAWWPPALVARVSEMPYLLPLAPRLGIRALVGGREPGRETFDRFLASRVDGLARCAAELSAGNVAALVIQPYLLGNQPVWVHGDQVTAAPATAATRHRADEALPMAALAAGAEVLVADDLKLTDGVGALLHLDPGVGQ